MRTLQVQVMIAILFIFIGMIRCVSVQQKGGYFMRSILLYNLHFRRPAAVGAMPNAIPGELEYKSYPLPNRSLDCRPLKSLFETIDLVAARKCLVGLKGSLLTQELIYRLKREAAPFLWLEPTKNVPPCFQEVLKKIPVPREIFFQSSTRRSFEINDGLQLGCYSARIPVAAEDFLEIKEVFTKWVLKVSLPISSILKNDRETIHFLSTWALAPFLDETKKGVLSKVVPTELCQTCMGAQSLFLGTEPLPPQWP